MHPFCNDPFNNNTNPVHDCASLSFYDLTPKTHCRKIIHKGTVIFPPIFFCICCVFFRKSIYLFIVVNSEWHIIRSCNKNDNLKLQDAQVYICSTDSCNSAENLRPAIDFGNNIKFWTFSLISLYFYPLVL